METKFIINRKELSECLRVVSNAVAGNKEPVFALRYILFCVTNGTLTVSACNGEFAIKRKCKLLEHTGNDASFCIYGKKFINAIRMIDDEPITVVVHEYQIEIVHSSGTMYIPTNECMETGNIIDKMFKVMDDTRTLAIETPCLRSVLGKCKFVIPDDAYRPVMNNVCMDIGTEFTRFAASDGHRLVVIKKNTIVSDSPHKILLSKNLVSALMRVLPETGFTEFEYVACDVVKKCIMRFDDTTVSFKMMDGCYPNYMNVVPKDFRNKAQFDRKKLVRALKRIEMFADSGSHYATFTLGDRKSVIKAEDIDESMKATECLPTDYDGCRFVTALKIDSLIEALNNIGCSENVVFMFNDPHTAFVLYPAPRPNNENIQILLMPMLVRDEDR